jgi:hypothetical protein
MVLSTLQDAKPDEIQQGERRTRSKSPQQVNLALMSEVVHSYDLVSFNEANQKQEWRDAMQVEYDALMKNNTWKLVELPPTKKPIGCKWVYHTKFKSDGSIDKYKARLVAKGYAQKEGIDYEETFAPTAKLITIKMLLALATQFGWQVHQMDIKSAFLNGDLQEEVYMEQPEGFAVEGKEKLVCKLVKALYGLKQAPQAMT